MKIINFINKTLNQWLKFKKMNFYLFTEIY